MKLLCHILLLAAGFEFGQGCQPRSHREADPSTENPAGDDSHASVGSHFVVESGGGGDSKTVQGNGQLGSEERSVGLFSGVSVGGTVALYLSQAMPTAEVRLEGETNILPLLIVSVKANGILSIEPKPRSRGFLSIFPIKAYCSGLTLDELKVGGASKILMSTALNGKSVRVTVEGASRVEIPSGHVDSIHIDARGASKVLAFGLQADSVKATAVDGYVVEVTALKSLTGSTAGLSRIYYRGSPQLDTMTQLDASITKSD